MREGWEYKKLGDVCNILNGFAFKSDKYTEQGIRVLRITNVQKGAIVDNAPKYYPLHEKLNIKQYLLNEDDLLMSLTGNVGRVGLLQRELLPAALNQRVACLRIASNKVQLKYLFHLLNSNNFEKDCIFNAAGIAQKNMSTEWLKKYTIPIPPLSEQERIVSELDLLSSIIEKKKAQLQEYDQLAQSIFYDMFGDPVTNEKGWEVKNMGEVGELQRGSGLSKKDLIDNGHPCILYGQIHTRFGAFTKTHIACIPQELVRSAKIAHCGDVIMAITSEDVEGSCKSVAWMGDYDIAIGSDAAIYRHSLNGIYFSYYTQTKAFHIEKAKYAKGFKVTHISTKEIASIPIPLPPLSLQQQFAEKIEAIEKQKELIKQSITETETLFNSRMDYYFN